MQMTDVCVSCLSLFFFSCAKIFGCFYAQLEEQFKLFAFLGSFSEEAKN